MENKKTHSEKYRKVMAVLKLSLFLVIIIGIPLYVYFFHHDFIEELKNYREVVALLRSYRTQGFLVYLGVMVLQIVISIIPGQVLQLAAGYLYGFWFGLIFSLIGAVIGSFITYYLAKIIGKDAMHVLFGEKKINEVLEHMNSRRAVAIVFLIYLIPGLPKDICNYVAGLSELKFRPFIIISTLGRTPGIMGSLLIGHQIMQGNYTSAIIIGVVAVILFILGIIFRNRVIEAFNKFYDKIMRTNV
ncbi:MAG: TVP38/TMEM64 family protein [Clostridia bacterium]|nr:TVP38/TMEM64 family protein [Clostridia bacterium]